MSPSGPLRSAASTAGLGRLAAALGVFTALLRLPFAARYLWDHDSVQFALGVESFNLAAHHPHPPGYPVYIALLKMLQAVGVDPLHGMLVLSILAGGVGAALVVLLAARCLEHPWLGAGETLANPRAGALLAGVLYATNPLLWFYGELPLVYAVEGGLSVAVAYGAAVMGRSRRTFLVVCVVFALAAGVRPSTGVLLAPLFLAGVGWAWWRGRARLGWVVQGALVGMFVVAAWLLPLLAAAGGLAAYRGISAGLFGTLLPRTSVLYGAGIDALLHNLEVLVKWSGQALVPSLAAVLVAVAMAWRRGDLSRGLRRGVATLRGSSPLLAAWIAPPVTFFLLFHITKAGYTFVYLPALPLAVALGLSPMLSQVELGGAAPLSSSGRSRLGVRAMLAVSTAAAVGISLFFFGVQRQPSQPKALALVLHEFHLGTLRAYEEELESTLATVREQPPDSVLLVTVELAGTGGAGAQGYLYPWHRHLQWYLPEYSGVMLAPAAELSLRFHGHGPMIEGGLVVPVEPGVRRLVFVLAGLPGEALRLPPAQVVYSSQNFVVLAAPFSGRLELGPFTLERVAGEGAVEERRARGSIEAQPPVAASGPDGGRK